MTDRAGVSEGRPEPRTPSGRVLWQWLGAPSPVTVESGRALILAIEDEAGTQETPGLRGWLERARDSAETEEASEWQSGFIAGLNAAIDEAALSGSPQELDPRNLERRIGDALDMEQVANVFGGGFESGEIRWLAHWIAVQLEVGEPPGPLSHREALWAKFTAGEKLAYGCGYRDGRNEAASPSIPGG